MFGALSYWILICVLIIYSNIVCLGDLYQVNRIRTLCNSDVAEFVCSQYGNDVVIWGFSANGGSQRRISFLFPLDNTPEGRIKHNTLESTRVEGLLIFGNSSFFKSSLTIDASLSVTISCNSIDEIIYRPLDSEWMVDTWMRMTLFNENNTLHACDKLVATVFLVIGWNLSSKCSTSIIVLWKKLNYTVNYTKYYCTVCNVHLLESGLVPTDIFLTSTDTDPSSYNISWMPFLSNVRFIITVYPPESYTQEDLIIHNTDNSTVHNITITHNDCPHRIYSIFIFGKKCPNCVLIIIM